MQNESNPNDKQKKNSEKEKKTRKQEKAENEITKIEIKDFEDLQNLVNSLGLDGKKKTKLHLVSRFVKNPFLNILIYLLVNLALIIAALGYSSFITFDAFYKILIYVAGFTVIEVILTEILYYFFPLYALMTFGQTVSFVLIIMSIGYSYFMKGVDIPNIFVMILVTVIITAIKRFLINYVHLNFSVYNYKTK